MTTTQGHEFSQHAFKRGQQRGIKAEIVRLVLDRADIDLHVGNGCHAVRISRKKLKTLKNDGVTPSLVERCSDVVLVHEPGSGTVITALRDLGRRGRRYRKQMKTWRLNRES